MLNQQQNNQNQNNNGKGGIKIEIDNPIPIKASTQIEFISNHDLAVRVTSFMKQIFKDYKGTNIFRDEFNNINVSLFFSASVNNANGSITALEKIDQESKGNAWEQQFSAINRTLKGNNKPFTLSTDGKEVLSRFFDGKVNWDQVITFKEDYPIQNGFSMAQSKEIILCVSYANINKIMTLMHGSVKEVDWDSNKHRFSYLVKFNRAKMPIQQNQLLMNQIAMMNNQMPMDQMMMMQNQIVPQYDMFGNIIPKSYREEEIILELICFDDTAYQEVSNLVGMTVTQDKGIVMF